MNKHFVVAVLIGLALVAPIASAQSLDPATVTSTQVNPDAQYDITTRDGQSFIGRIVEITPTQLRLRISSGEVTLERAAIRSIEALNESGSKGWYRAAVPNRYNFLSSAYNLRKGEWNLHSVLIAQNSLGYGITDWLQIGAGFNLIALINGTFAINGHVKLSYPISDDFRIGASVSAYGLPEANAGFLTSLAQLTYGSTDHNLTVGGGALTAFGASSSVGALQLAGTTRLGRPISLFVETLFLFETFGTTTLATPGIRLQSRRLAADIGVTVVNFSSSSIAFSETFTLPMLGITYRFGNPRAR